MRALVGAVIAWCCVAALTAGIGFGLQWLWFAQPGDTPGAYLSRWPILWLLYFFAAISITEHLTRLVTKPHDR